MPKGAKKAKNSKQPAKETKMLYKDTATEYAIVTKKLGQGCFSVKLNGQQTEYRGRLCGKFRHRSEKRSNFVEVGSVVLVGLRDYETGNVVDIINVYSQEATRLLYKSGELMDENKNSEETDVVFEKDETTDNRQRNTYSLPDEEDSKEEEFNFDEI